MPSSTDATRHFGRYDQATIRSYMSLNTLSKQLLDLRLYTVEEDQASPLPGRPTETLEEVLTTLFYPRLRPTPVLVPTQCIEDVPELFLDASHFSNVDAGHCPLVSVDNVLVERDINTHVTRIYMTLRDLYPYNMGSSKSDVPVPPLLESLERFGVDLLRVCITMSSRLAETQSSNVDAWSWSANTSSGENIDVPMSKFQASVEAFESEESFFTRRRAQLDAEIKNLKSCPPTTLDHFGMIDVLNERPQSSSYRRRLMTSIKEYALKTAGKLGFKDRHREWVVPRDASERITLDGSSSVYST